MGYPVALSMPVGETTAAFCGLIILLLGAVATLVLLDRANRVLIQKTLARSGGVVLKVERLTTAWATYYHVYYRDEGGAVHSVRCLVRQVHVYLSEDHIVEPAPDPKQYGAAGAEPPGCPAASGVLGDTSPSPHPADPGDPPGRPDDGLGQTTLTQRMAAKRIKKDGSSGSRDNGV